MYTYVCIAIGAALLAIGVLSHHVLLHHASFFITAHHFFAVLHVSFHAFLHAVSVLLLVPIHL